MPKTVCAARWIPDKKSGSEFALFAFELRGERSSLKQNIKAVKEIIMFLAARCNLFVDRLNLFLSIQPR